MAGLLKERQIDAIRCMLNLNSPPVASDIPQWKVLVYDQRGRDIISPLFTVKELRSFGVTLHLLLDTSREHIPDVPAIYFVVPSRENIVKICEDFESGRYESYYLNFISPISRENLELIAQSALSEDCVQQITKVFDQYTNFICLEEDLVVLQPLPAQQLSYYALNRPNTSDNDIEQVVASAVDGLFSVFATLGTVPIIRCSCRDAAEMVATRLVSKLRDSLRDSRNSLFVNSDASRAYGLGGGTNDHVGPPLNDNQGGNQLPGSTRSFSFANLFQRPLLVLLDRNLDLATPLHHELTYQSLVHDIFNIHLNRIQVDLSLTKEVAQATDNKSSKSPLSKKTGKLEQYYLNSASDRLWREFRGAAFSDVAEAIREEVNLLRDYEKHMGELKTSMGLSGDLSGVDESTLTLLDDQTSRLSTAISSLPQLMERKRCLDMHTNIATCLANVITHRQLHVFAEEEDKLLSRQATSVGDSLALSEFSIIRLPKLGQFGDQSTGGLRNSASRSVLNKLVSHGSAIFLTGVRHLIGRKSYLPFTRIVSQLMENRSCPELEEFRYFDPKLLRRQTSETPRFKQPFNDAFVFVIGGGSYVEYQDLLDWSRATTGGGTVPGEATSSSSGNATVMSNLPVNGTNALDVSATAHSSTPGTNVKRVVYGCTELLSPKEFLSQLTALGKELC
ncbi:unnamed protein product [Dicrocoelium dendriticum]|nr:unnamed protein product [Dicrocoelium dendriticum]